MWVSWSTRATMYGDAARSLSARGQGDDVGRRGDHRALDVRLLEVVRGEAGVGMQRAHAEHARVGADRADEVDGGGAHGDLGALVQPAADDHHLGARVIGERGGDRRRVREHGHRPVGRQAPRDLEVRGGAVEQHDARAGQHAHGRLGELRLGLRRGAAPVGERARLRRGRQRAAVDALHQPLGGELAQVAPDRVLRHAELRHEPGGDDLAVARERSRGSTGAVRRSA